MGENPEISINNIDENVVHASEHSRKEHHHRHKKKILKTYSLWDDILLVFLVTFAASVANYSENIPEFVLGLYKSGTAVLLCLMWFGLSLYSGLKSKWKFAVFTLLFWLIPVAGIFLYEAGPEAFGLSIIMYVISEFFRLLVIDSTASVMSVLGISGMASALVFMLINLLFFFGTD